MKKESWHFDCRAPGADLYRRKGAGALDTDFFLEVPDEVTLIIAQRERQMLAQALEKSIKNITVKEILELIKSL